MSSALRPSTMERLIRECAVASWCGASPFLHLIAPESVRRRSSSALAGRTATLSDMDDGAWISDLVAALRVRPGTRVTVPEDLDPTYKPDFIAKRDRAALLSESVQLLASYQTRLAAQERTACCCVCRGSTAPGRTAPSATS